MYEEAKAKLQAEIDANKDNAYVHYVGQFLISHLDINPLDGDKITAADKTVAKSLDAMKAEASKKKIGNMAMLTPDEGMAVVFKYFGIQGKAAIVPELAPAAPPAPTVSVSTGSDFSVSLEEFGL